MYMKQATSLLASPVWLVFLLTEVHTLVLWLGLQRRHDVFSHLLAFQAFLLPAMLWYLTKHWRHTAHTPKRAQQINSTDSPHPPTAPSSPPTLCKQHVSADPWKPLLKSHEKCSLTHFAHNAAMVSSFTDLSSCQGYGSDMPSTGLIKNISITPAYKSCWGTRHKVCIKIATHHHPSHIRRGAVQHLAERVSERLSSTSRRTVQVLSGSVTYGCVLINLDVCACTLTDTEDIASRFGSERSSSGSLQFTAEQASACAQQLLPALMHDLGLEDASADSNVKAKSSVLSAEQFLTLQLDKHLVEARRGPQGQDWAFSTRTVQWYGGSDLPQLCLAQPSVGHATRAAATRPAGVFLAAFQVQIWCRGSAMSPLVVGSNPVNINTSAMPKTEAATPQAPTPQASSSSLAHVGHTTTTVGVEFEKPRLQLWVRCQGQYLNTSIEVAAMCPTGQLDSASQVGMSLLYVVAEVPIAALARHHQPDGPIACLQLLSVELWAGDSLLSTTPLLLDTTQHMLPALPRCSFGWWGASAAHAVGMVQEVTALTDEAKSIAAAYPGTADADAVMESREDCVSDMAAWLATMQQMAPSTCCDFVPRSTGIATGLPVSTCTTVGLDLKAFAQELQLPHTLSLLRSQQAKVLNPWYASTAATGASGANTPHGNSCGRRLLKASMERLGHWLRHSCSSGGCSGQCSACDAVYCGRLRVHLRQANVYVGILLGSSTLLMCRAHEVATLAVTMSNAWAAMHLVAAAAAAIQAPMMESSAGSGDWGVWFLRGGAIQGMSWIWHVCIELTLLLGISSMSGAVCKPATMGAFLACHTIFVVVSEQVHVWGRWPGWLVRTVQVVEAIAHTNLSRTCPSFPWWFNSLVIPSSALVLPTLMNWHWRSLLRRGDRKRKPA